MKLSKRTIEIMKNYSKINTNLLILEGNKLTTKSPKNTIISSVTVSENFPVEFGIYDLNMFLGSVSMFDDPILEFDSKFVTISSEKSDDKSIRYYRAERGVLVYPDRDIKFPQHEIQFELSATDLASIYKSASALHAEVVSIISEDGIMYIQVGKQKQESSCYRIQIGTTENNFKVNILIDHFKMMPSNYEVSIHPKISRFQSTDNDLVYYIAVESDSKFE